MIALERSVVAQESLERQGTGNGEVAPVAMKCYCNALTGRAWRMRHGDTPCDGSICSYQREKAEKVKSH